jgi:hypothetical protein
MSRTIGITGTHTIRTLMAVALTKVDRVEAGNEDKWIQFIEKWGHRCFVTCPCAGPDARSKTKLNGWAGDRDIEKKILENNPWRRIVPVNQRGIHKLRGALSEFLAEMIKGRLLIQKLTLKL